MLQVPFLTVVPSVPPLTALAMRGWSERVTQLLPNGRGWTEMLRAELLQHVHLQHPLPRSFPLLLPIVVPTVQLHLRTGRLLRFRLLVRILSPLVTAIMRRIACSMLLVMVISLLLTLLLVSRVKRELYLVEEYRVYSVRASSPAVKTYKEERILYRTKGRSLVQPSVQRTEEGV